MSDPEKHLHSEQLEEYKLCHEKAISLERNIYTAATLFQIGSIAVFGEAVKVLFVDVDASFFTALGAFVVSLLAIGAWFTWLRLALRWKSVAYAMIVRMEHLERDLGMEANLYVRYLDDRNTAENDDSLPDETKKHLDRLIPKLAHEHRGHVPMLSFLAVINVAAWVILSIAQATNYLVTTIQALPNARLPFFEWIALLVFGKIVIYLGLIFGLYLYFAWQHPKTASPKHSHAHHNQASANATRLKE